MRLWKRSRRRAGQCVELIEHLGHRGAVLRTALGALDYQVVHELPPAPHLLQHVLVLVGEWEPACDHLAGQNAIAVDVYLGGQGRWLGEWVSVREGLWGSVDDGSLSSCAG